MAKRTIVMGINQTTMAALSMVTIAALISAPGLGQTVLQALTTLDVGTAFNGGLAIVIMAIVLDRTTTAAGEGTERTFEHGLPRGCGGASPGSARSSRRCWCGSPATFWWANTFPIRATRSARAS